MTHQEVGKKFHRQKVFKSPEELESLFFEYKEHCEETPLSRNEMIKSGQNAGKTFPVEMPHIMTMDGFALFVGYTKITLYNYGTMEDRSEFHDTYNKIKEYIDDHQIQHAVIGNYNERIIMAKQGLKDKKELGGKISLIFDKDDEGL